ncbi:MAG TPA: hypothetical protein VEC18_01750 [Myxococcota bacterium]|nr:hypothetical protein [Myxococcota bacterium]
MSRAPERLAAALALAACGCHGVALQRHEIARQPIAFIFHSESEARERAEAHARLALPGTSRTRGEPSVLHLNSLRDHLEAALGLRDADPIPGRLALLDPRSGRVTPLASAQRGAIPLAWSADRDRLLFAQRDRGTLQLFELDLESQVVSQRTIGPDHHPQGCYGPDGRLVVVIAKRAPRGSTPTARASLVSQLALMHADGSFAAISPGPMDGDPSCSSDGASVAYARSFARADSEIWLHSFELGRPEHALAPGREPAFSPDGEWIAYTRSEKIPPTLWRIRRDGSGRSRLGWGSGSAEYGPAFSPDGALVVYESQAGDRYRLSVRRFDGTGDSVLLADGDGTHAVW